MAFPKGKVPLMSISAGDAAPLAFDLTPVVQHGKHSIGIVGGSMSYVAEHLGLMPEPNNALTRAHAFELVESSEMMRNDIFYGHVFKRAKLRLEPQKLKTEAYNKWLGHFERFLR